ncbi:DUF3549 family protein [Colwellia psychrerythraea]|uniref:DUF3549 domain-containing protein n=1 Tax=Colwellia psychrerythraea (strain 34H / ATCC BAA-681) TaxID=167879 RepID=Q47Y01_COLP3|nr:DUF3549 family protein [Colwellia psychrerythraea]AAZ25512.1 hypothetical protein CPS_3651 [Colwellia psychrerythraea 34H]
MTDTAPAANIATLSELLKLSGSQYRLYDIGRLVSELPKEQFEKVELNQLPYPTPTQGCACIAIAFWQKQSSQPYLWLLKLPLDERGLLNQGARNHFIAIIVEALGADLTQETSKKQEELLSSNPYLFTPAQYKLASLNSKIKVDLKQQPSAYFSPFREYLSHGSDWGNWQGVGVQGITDFIARIKHDNHSELLLNALPHLPDEVLSPVCSALENEQYPVVLIDALVSALENALIIPDNSVKTMQLLRSLAANSDHTHVRKVVGQLLSNQEVSSELLITLSGRCWQALADEKMLMCYFEHLLSNNNLPLFSSIFKDLVTIPLIRPVAFQCIRSEDRSPALAQAIGQLLSQT